MQGLESILQEYRFISTLHLSYLEPQGLLQYEDESKTEGMGPDGSALKKWDDERISIMTSE